MSESTTHSSPSQPVPAEVHDPHAVPHDAAHFHDHAKLYLLIGAILIAATCLTVALAYVNFGSHEANIAIGLLVATVKATLVALIFMHLKSERKTIYQFMAVTVIAVIGLIALSALGIFDHIKF